MNDNVFHVADGYQPLMREIGLDAEAVFYHPSIVPWRKLPDRENCTLDATRPDASRVRLHVKRYASVRTHITPAEAERGGYAHLERAGIATVDVVGWGRVTDGRSFFITRDLAGYEDAEKMLARGALAFESLLQPAADLSAKLHNAKLHHRDLYLCHFFVRVRSDASQSGPTLDLKLIDAARVRPLGSVFTRGRWIVKDLAQFWYSTMNLPGITDAQRARWLQRYAEKRGLPASTGLRRTIERKVRWIAQHDENLRARQPGRNISIPKEPGS